MMNSLYKCLATFALANFLQVSAHVEMQAPAPRKSQFNKGYGSAPDYDMNAPLGAFPCKGYGKGPSVQTVSSGSSVPVTLLGEATHNGGHCQFSLSYDNGATFVVIKTIIGTCLTASAGYNYDVQIPKEAPNGDVIFAWSWINRTGNREYYMNCADITIKGSSSTSLSGPKLTVANLPGYTIIPEFTDGGYDGSELFSKAPQITVGGNAAGGGYEVEKIDSPKKGQGKEQAVNSPSPLPQSSSQAPTYTPVPAPYQAPNITPVAPGPSAPAESQAYLSKFDYEEA